MEVHGQEPVPSSTATASLQPHIYRPMYTTPSEPHGTGPDPSPHPGGSISTPQGTRPPGTRPPGSGHKYATPKNVILNPFEAGLDDLHLPAYMSPGFFTVTSTPASEERRQFRWSIEHLAELNPADIDPMPMHQAPAVLAVFCQQPHKTQKEEHPPVYTRPPG
ncbi:hypothetical protein DPMN_103652 [Dreissena polymorpha]|uniref:Protein aurora borealis n=1 Tax=Dreissena polymorpha TaxID=45954 RepID=A0A9D4H6E2_DREPO|nr:hypothetical protein DPMN_103652 [Dreissena polymorpha]